VAVIRARRSDYEILVKKLRREENILKRLRGKREGNTTRKLRNTVARRGTIFRCLAEEISERGDEPTGYTKEAEFLD